MNPRSLVAAGSVAAVEGLKDQGFARWNHPVLGIQQHVKTNFGSYSQLNRVSTSTTVVLSNTLIRDHKLKQCDQSLNNVMFFNCWGTI